MISIVFFLIVIIGFMIKLPIFFRHFDKELHTMFYFFSAALLNVLYKKRHLIIVVFLLIFGICIEFAQEYSNKFFHKRIHGRFDLEDIKANIRGIVAFSIIWLFIFFINYINSKKNNC
ncbi:hypothetical protein HNP99_003226 [Flavobacterium sp. 28A]|uniref:hypothetical protein n=1 Tax=Flavobacterium sp. 28A TaxID=2735895 RepID=UPI0015700E56|nr:hypothetical protein [Flavobacterium sp. 28A]NRT16852.1 hypothetical protein [Flavobacterium sp. 28A]